MSSAWGMLSVEDAMRTAVVIVVAALAGGCFGSDRGADINPGDDGAPPPEDRSCETSADCVAAGASCCACAEYAVNTTSDFAMACEDVMCPPPEATCAGLEPTCSADHQCVLTCKEIECGLTCPGGFVVDSAGCLTCECAAGPAPECSTDTDCARVHADCCGCALGGADTAVPATQVEQHDADLMCPPDPVCPGVDVCTPGDVAQCVGGRCELGQPSPATPPTGACGTPDLPPCPAGQTCVLNSDDGATEQGLGVCQ